MRPISVHKDTDDHLIEEILEGNQDRYNVLVQKYQDYTFTLALRILKNREEAEEAAHDAFVKAFHALKNFNRAAKFSTWLFRIVFNTAISYQRKQKSYTQDIESVQYTLAGEDTAAMENEDRKRFVQRALQQLSALDNTIITLFYFEDLSLEEISDITGIKSNAVKVRLFRARKKLADELRNILNSEALTL